MDNSNELVRIISEASGKAADTVNRNLKELQDTSRNSITESAAALSKRMQDWQDIHKATLAQSSDGLTQKLQELQETTRFAVAQATSALIEKTEELQEVARTAVGQASAAFAQKTHDLRETTETSVAQSVALLTQKLQELRDTTQTAVAESTATLSGKSQEVQDMTRRVVEESITTIVQRLAELQETSHDAVEQSKQTGVAAVSEILETHGMLRTDTTALFERLREANALIQEVLSGAQNNLGAIEQGLSSRINEFVETMNELLTRTGATTEKVGESVGSFQEISGKVLSELSEIVVQFDSHGRSLSAMVEMIDTSNRRTDESVSARRQELDNLVTTLDSRTEDLELRLKRFSDLLDESLVAAEGRTRDIARLVAEASSQSARAIAEQHDQVRIAAEDERQRTLDELHGVYEQASNEAHALFRQTTNETEGMLQNATERFSEVLQGMRQMTAEMQHELEGTRQELRRGIFELPQETAESAAQMRRVIVDQIEALAELNRIVARHGHSIDTAVADPNRRVYREEPLLASVTGGRHEMEQRASTPPRQASWTDMPAPTPAPPPPPAPRRAEPAAPPPAPVQEKDKGRGGWLSDLLSRASRDNDEPIDEERTPVSEHSENGLDDESSPHYTIESLDTLSVDIARMIDHDATAELWDRYNRGERNVFTRRLYTTQGQKTFDEVRKRYRGDLEFRDTVDRYIDEFEQLLDEVSRSDRGQVVARTYLTSETGKVYTMLAHAAGRLDD